MDVHVVRHPLVEDVLASLRDGGTPCDVFRQLAHRVSLLLVAEDTRDLALAPTAIETPLKPTTVHGLAARVVAPDATVYTAPVDRELNARKLILPGLGDFGDRLFGT